MRHPDQMTSEEKRAYFASIETPSIESYFSQHRGLHEANDFERLKSWMLKNYPQVAYGVGGRKERDRFFGLGMYQAER